MTETPVARRSVRGNSATPVTSARGRSKAAKAGPLPAVPTAISQAYGAPGKVSLGTQINVSGGEGGFAAGINAIRAAAESVSDDSADEATAPPSARLRSRRGSATPSHTSHAPSYKSNRKSVSTTVRTSRPVPQSIDEEVDDDDDDDDDIHDFISVAGKSAKSTHSGRVEFPSYTEIDTGFSYSAITANRTSSRFAPSLEPPATHEELEAAEPWSFIVFWETIHRWMHIPLSALAHLSSLLKSTLLLSLLLAILTATFWPSAPVDLLEGGVSTYHKAGDLFTGPFSSPSFKLPSFSSHVIQDTELIQRVSTLESDVRQLRKEFRSATVKLEEILPEHIMVQKDAATGEWELPSNFWNALRERLAEEGSSIAWESFIASNKIKLDEAADSSVEKAMHSRSHIVNQEKFIGRIEQIATEVATRTSTSLIQALPATDKGSRLLYELALANLARNTQLAIQTVNYFAWGLGAVVDPYLTSPTYQKQMLSWYTIRGLYKMLTYKGPMPYSSDKTLQRWDEATDCWCAAKSDDKGKAQLAVLMPHAIMPTSITIEHIPARGTLDIGAAPKEFEVWVTNTEQDLGLTSTHAKGLEQQCGEQPDTGFICIGTGRYDIHGPNHIQNFALEAEELTGPANKVVVKVKNNWGQDHTCLYRVRMHGEQQAAVAEDPISEAFL